MEFSMVEMIGYAASIMVAISLSMKHIVALRVLNLVGCSLFIAYGLYVGALPVVVANSYIACINLYFLFRQYQETKAASADGVNA
ncbi:hypothetical protein CSW98_05510 [Vibrio sp. HA2012]|uniref:YgjV family protein n=1 Tax=Vibrio sp. HA2012 TaxID=1971595 RepID=UPI000C2B67DB|nr:YgjV family protein [Vibrio sp. HA2012]PJC87356.1 hypothetical protein CSW98_05510 [Vibrio sp. HA2012]